MSNTILVGIDGSDGALRALDFAASQARLSNQSLTVCYVIEWSPFTFNTPSENEERHRRREEEMTRAHADLIEPQLIRLAQSGVKAKGMVRHGHAATALKDLGVEVDASSVVIGRKGTSRLASMMFGSVAGSLVQIADRPVTVVP
jgi:nucleotide-binding universal stress UspA family protein